MGMDIDESGNRVLPPGVDYRSIYLSEGSGTTDTSLNGGRLAFDPPASDEHADSFTYDPGDPVESVVEYPDYRPRDYGPVEHRLLTYTSEMLEDDLVLVGPVNAVLYAASSKRDTDWVVRLCDVHPDGRSLSVCDGILRARYRDSLEQPEPMQPDTVYRFQVDLWATAHTFKAGHRLRVHVTSSDFPRYDRNLNTGGPIGHESEWQIATNTVFHDAGRPSHLVLPVYGPPSV